MRHKAQKIFGTFLALGMTILSACGPNTQLPENVVQLDLKAISVSKFTDAEGSKSTASVQLGWEGIPGDARSLKLFRRKVTDNSIIDFAAITDLSTTTFTDEKNLEQGQQYIYNLRADNDNSVTVAKVESDPLDIALPGSIKSFKLTIPGDNEQQLFNLGSGIEFQWEDAGTNLYYVSVDDTKGNIIWGALTKSTRLRYGADSEFLVPLALTKEFIISKPNPDSKRNEVRFVGIGSGGTFNISVSAIQTIPKTDDLAAVSALAIRPAQSIRFITK